jgi:hypothetical protein
MPFSASFRIRAVAEPHSGRSPHHLTGNELVRTGKHNKVLRRGKKS